ncbi:mannosyltransferase [Talaromyces marneffei ATCC 18224]
MRTSLLIYSMIVATASVSVVDTNFMDERDRLAKDWTGRGGDPAEKYFHSAAIMMVVTPTRPSITRTKLRIYQP